MPPSLQKLPSFTDVAVDHEYCLYCKCSLFFFVDGKKQVKYATKAISKWHCIAQHRSVQRTCCSERSNNARNEKKTSGIAILKMDREREKEIKDI